MTPQELKNSILQLAIQGKLVEQRPEEGTAEELFAQIQEEKRRLIQEGKIKKEKTLPEITDDEKPFEIPEGWMWVRLKDICSKITDGTHHSPPNSEVGVYKYITAKNIKDLGVDLTNISYVSQEIHEEIYSRCNPEPGDILLIKDGATTGVVTVNDLIEAFSMLSSVALLKQSKFVDAWYIVYALRSDLLYKIIRLQMKGTGITRITLKQIEPMVIPLPPLAEQKRIVAKIEELLPYIDRYEQAWSKLEQFNSRFPEDMKKSLLQYAIQGKLVEQRPEEGTAEELFAQIQEEKRRLIQEGKIKKEKPLPEITDDEKPFEIPEGWMWVRLGNVISLVSGTDFKPEQYNDQGRGTVYITGASNLSDDGVIVSRWTETPRNFAYLGDILLVCKGSGYGKTVFCNVNEAHIARQIMAIKQMDAINMGFIRYFLQANITYLKTQGQGVIPGIDRASILNMFLPLPPLAEQQRIVEKLEQLLPLCERSK